MKKIGLYGFNLTDVICMDVGHKKVLQQMSNQLRISAAKSNYCSLSALQIGQGHNMFCMLDFHKFKKSKWFDYDMKPSYYQIYVNPVILDTSEQKQLVWQKCSSYPGLQFLMNRANHLKVNYQKQKKTLDSIDQQIHLHQAHVFQHQMMHLQGKDLLQQCQDIDIINPKLKKIYYEQIQKLFKSYKNEQLKSIDNLQNNKQIKQIFKLLKRAIVYSIIDNSRY